MWKDEWREELRDENKPCYDRLSECRSKHSDIKIIAKLMYKYNPDKSKEECLDRTILWITDWNSQVSLIPDEEEYKKILLSI